MELATTKNKELLSIILDEFGSASVTALMKLCYLVDCKFVKDTSEQLSDFSYIRYNFGPYDQALYFTLNSLENAKVISSSYQPHAYEAVKKFTLNELTPNVQTITEDEENAVREYIKNLCGFDAKTLTHIAYKTKPMTALGATLGGTEALGQSLNLSLYARTQT